MAMKTSAVPQNAQLAARPRSNYALFLGDLSIFCCEKDIEDAFASYGEIVNVRIQRSKETSRALSYGFIEFSCETAAVTAMNEMNSFVLKGRPLRIRWAAKRNQPVKSENAALHTAATIFVKFASQTGIIVSEQLMREHFSVFGQILDATIRTITIDEAYNRSKGYGFVNFINDETQDGLSVAYKAAADLQNATVNGVNYRCEVGHKHQPNKQQQGGAADSDSVSMGAYSSGAASMAVSASSASRASFLPSISPKHGYYAQMGQQVGQQVPVHSGASVNSANSHSSSGPSSPHPASFYPVNPAAQQQVQQQQQMSSNASVHSVGSGSASGVYAPAFNTSPHSPHHPVSTIVSTISFVPTPGGGMPTMPTMPNIYTQGQAGLSSQQGSGSVYSSPTHAQGHYTPAQQQYFQQQQQYLQQQQQQQYYAQQQQGHAGQYYAQQQGMYPQQQQQQAAYYGAQQQQGAQGQQQQGGYYSAEQYPQQQAAAAAQAQAQQQYYAQGYYAHPGPMSVSGGSVGSHGRTARSSAAYEATTGAANANTSYLNEQTLSQQQQQGQIQGQQQQAMRPRRVAGLAQPMNQNYMMSQQQAPYYGQQQGYMQPVEVAQPSNGRRSQRNVSNQSNISEITSATLNELDQGDDDDEEEQEEENAGADVDADADQEQADRDEQDNEAAAANAAAMISGLRMDSADDASVRSPTNANAAATQHLKSTLQIQATTSQPINCKLSERRRRNVSGGSNTTEITAEMLYDLQQQEQRLEQEEEEEGTIEPPKSQPSSPTKGSARVAAAASNKPRSPAPGASPRTPRLSANKGECSPPPGGAARARESSTASIAPFTMSAQALDELQKQAEAADALSKDRRTKRSSSERSNQSDITAALAYMGLDNSSAEQQFRALEDEEDAASSAENSVSVCICGKALDASARQSAGSPYASSCPYGTSACSCVYKATY